MCPTCGYQLWLGRQVDGRTEPAGRPVVDLHDVLRAHHGVVDEVVEALPDLRLPHYENLGADSLRERVTALHRLILDCLEHGDLGPMTDRGRSIATERFAAGFEISEVLAAFNLLDEALWRIAGPHLPAADHAEARGRISRVMAAGKDSVAQTWVRVASEPKAEQADHLIATVAESVGFMHPTIPKGVLEQMAREALGRTANARVKGHRVPLAHHDVRENALRWERRHGQSAESTRPVRGG